MEKKRKFLFVSLSGLVGDIAWQVLKEGHEVRYFIGDEEEKDIADGFVPKSDDWEKDVDWADVIVFDDTLGQGAQAEKLRARGQGGRRRQRLHRPARGRPLLRAGGAQEGRRHDHPVQGLRVLRRGDRSTSRTTPAATSSSPPARRQRQAAPLRRRRRGRARRRPDARGLQEGLLRRDQGLPAPEARRRRRGRRRRVLQRQGVRLPDQHQLRAQEALPRQHRPADGRDGHVDVLERAEQALRADPAEDGAASSPRRSTSATSTSTASSTTTASTRSSSRRASGIRRSSSSRRA